MGIPIKTSKACSSGSFFIWEYNNTNAYTSDNTIFYVDNYKYYVADPFDKFTINFSEETNLKEKRKMFTEEEIGNLLEASDEAVERAILRLGQIQEEEVGSEENGDEGHGFNKYDYKFMMSLRIFIKNSEREVGNRLSKKMREAAREILKKYVEQLTKYSNEHFIPEEDD